MKFRHFIYMQLLEPVLDVLIRYDQICNLLVKGMSVRGVYPASYAYAYTHSHI